MAKMSIKLASKGKTSFDLSSNHITTTDFGQLQVSNILPVVPGDKINASLFSEARFAPMVVPTFMDVDLISRSYYVPMSAIWQPFENFYTDKQDQTAFKGMPTFTNAQLVAQLVLPSNGYTNVAFSGQAYDFQTGSTKYVLTEKGRLLTKLFHSLGYGINYTANDTTPMSYLPLMAFMRVCYDYVYPSQYIDGLGLTQYFKCTDSSSMATLYTNGLHNLLEKLSALLVVPYNQDYFTAAWNQLNSPGTAEQSFFINSPASVSGYTEKVESYDKAVELHHTGNNGNTVLTQYGLNLLSRLYDFVTRNNIVGTRYADQIFARFGIGSRKSDPDMSQFIGQHIQPVNVVDVTAMSAAEGQDLGDLAGKAYINGSGNLFNFESTDEFGFIITISHIAPKIGYYQGRKRWTTATNRFDFYTPEFDMQMRAIRNDELFADYKDSQDYVNNQNYGANPTESFAFAPNYAEYKKGDDYISGDFRNNSLNTGLDSYFIYRDIPMPDANHVLDLNADFLFMQQHQFDKIFAQPSTLRAPLSLRETGDYGSSLVCYEDKPIVFLNSDSAGTPTYDYVCLAFENNKGKLDIVCYDPDLIDLKEYFGIDLDDLDTYYPLPFAHHSNGNRYQFAAQGVQLHIHDITANKLFGQDGYTPVVTHKYEIGTYTNANHYEVFETYDELISWYRDYIDHIYLRHHFDIKANRSMIPVSEEFMIEDGGSTVSVDMNGNRF